MGSLCLKLISNRKKSSRSTPIHIEHCLVNDCPIDDTTVKIKSMVIGLIVYQYVTVNHCTWPQSEFGFYVIVRLGGSFRSILTRKRVPSRLTEVSVLTKWIHYVFEAGPNEIFRLNVFLFYTSIALFGWILRGNDVYFL